ncbi:MAG: metallophosphoesterase family protein [Rufibacter sp.]
MKKKFFQWLQGWVLVTCLQLLSACDLFEYHPYEGNIEYRDLTAKNVARIKELEKTFDPATPLYIAFISDTQGFFKETEDMVKDINQRNVHFALHAGDLTNYAFTDEYERMHEVLSKLKVPYVTVVGNHDCVGEGKKLFQRMYGPFDYSFTFQQNKFIFLNTNFLEFDEAVPDLEWLEKELQEAPGITNKFVASHMAPDNGEANPGKEQAYARLMRNYNVKLSLHGHTHNYKAAQLYHDGITYVTTPAADKRSYVLIKVLGKQVTFEKIDY